MGFIERCIHSPVTVAVGMFLVFLFGSRAFQDMPLQLTPNVDQPVITISTRWFGASPQEIEEEIIKEQEDVLKSVSGLREMVSRATDGEGTVRLLFDVSVDLESALNQVRDKLRQVRKTPRDAAQPIVDKVDRFARAYIAWMLVRPGPNYRPPATRPADAPAWGSGQSYVFDGDVTTLQDFLEDMVKPELERVDGVAEVNVLGGRIREMQVRADLQLLAARGITISQFTQALRQENLSVTAGTITEGKRDVSVRAVGQYDDPEQLRRTVVARSPDGSPVYLADVAQVVPSFKKQRWLVRSKGQDVIAINVQREAGSNVLEVLDGLRGRLEELNRGLMSQGGWGLELALVYDQSIYINQALKNARNDLMLGAALAAIVLFATLRSFGATLVILVVIPVSVVGAVLGMWAFGRNLNVISIAGLTFSIAMGIDNAIVVLENIFRHREMGKGRIRGAVDGTREVMGAIVAASLTNVAVFLPIIFIQEEAGQLFRDIAVAISVSMFFYLVLAPTVIPTLATLFLRKMPGGLRAGGAAAPPQTLLGRLTRPLMRLGLGIADLFYAIVYWLTAGAARRLVVFAVFVIGAALLTIVLIPPRTYLPSGNQNLVFGFLSTPPGYNLEERKGIGLTMEQRLAPWWSVKAGSAEHRQVQEMWREKTRQFAIPGMKQMAAAAREKGNLSQAQMFEGLAEGMERAYPPPIEHFFFVTTESGTFFGATSQEPQNVAPLAYVMNGAYQGIPGVNGFATQMPIFRLDRSFTGGGIEINVSGPDYRQVRDVAEQLQMRMMGVFGGFVNSDPQNFQLGRAETQVRPSRERAADAGVLTSDVREAAQVAVEGVIVGDYREGAKSVDLTVLQRAARAAGVEGLRQAPLYSPRAGVVPLASVADFEDTLAPLQISRYERQPAVSLSMPLPAGKTVQETTELVESQIVGPMREQGLIPPTVSVRPGGSADKLDRFIREFIPIFLFAAIVTYLLLASLYESFVHPLTIMMSVPLALVGGFAGLALLHHFTGQQMDVLTMLGFVILVGTIVNNPILIVHQALKNMEAGMDSRRAIALSTQTRVRPIFMSVATTVAGMTPLVVAGGEGSELYRGLGAVVVGGLIVSTIFTLILTPTVMSLTTDALRFVRGVLRLDSGDPEPAPTPAVPLLGEPIVGVPPLMPPGDPSAGADGKPAEPVRKARPAQPVARD